MKVYSIFRYGRFFILLCLFIVEGKKSPTGKHTCRKGLLFQVTENLYIKATSLKSSVPFFTRLLFPCFFFFQRNCSVRDQLLSFYMRNVFIHLGTRRENSFGFFSSLQLPCAPSTRLTSAVKKIKRTFRKLGEKGIYKAIHELDILLPWIQTYIQTVI
uniref:Interleukin family protein n=1 Tax=Nothoprocta perdicaria TaxID=30464 RepID=A0A8C6Z5U8_NOTPE